MAAPILTTALQAAADAGDPSPTLVQHVAAARDRANQIAGGDVVPYTGPSYLVAVRGKFTVSSGPGLSLDLPGLDNPIPAKQSYSVMTLVINAATGDVTDTGYSDDFPDLSAAGTPVTTDLG